MELSSNELIKKMPFSLEAEQSVLGSILINPECFSEIATELKSNDFYLETHKEIYKLYEEQQQNKKKEEEDHKYIKKLAKEFAQEIQKELSKIFK